MDGDSRESCPSAGLKKGNTVGGKLLYSLRQFGDSSGNHLPSTSHDWHRNTPKESLPIVTDVVSRLWPIGPLAYAQYLLQVRIKTDPKRALSFSRVRKSLERLGSWRVSIDYDSLEEESPGWIIAKGSMVCPCGEHGPESSDDGSESSGDASESSDSGSQSSDNNACKALDRGSRKQDMTGKKRKRNISIERPTKKQTLVDETGSNGSIQDNGASNSIIISDNDNGHKETTRGNTQMRPCEKCGISKGYILRAIDELEEYLPQSSGQLGSYLSRIYNHVYDPKNAPARFATEERFKYLDCKECEIVRSYITTLSKSARQYLTTEGSLLYKRDNGKDMELPVLRLYLGLIGSHVADPYGDVLDTDSEDDDE